MMQKDGILEQGLSLRELYNKYLHPDVLPLDDKDTWNTIQNASSLNLFQLDSTIGRQGAKKVRPKNMQELSDTNGSKLALTHFSVYQQGHLFKMANGEA